MPEKVQAQSWQTDLKMLQGDTARNLLVHDLLLRRPRWYKRYNPIYWGLNGALTVYQRVLSPQLSRDCGFQLSCSRFSREAIKEFGMVKGVALTADRLSRCNAVAGTDIHPFYLTKGRVQETPAQFRTNHKHD